MVTSAKVANTQIGLSDFTLEDAEGNALSRERPAGYLVAGGEFAVAVAPPGGWIASAIAAVPPAPAVVTTPAKVPVSTAPLPICDATASILGFDNGAVVPDSAVLSLADVVTQANASECAVEIIGYASTSGSQSTNQRIAQQRADAIAALLAQGSTFAAQTVEGRGETAEFGPDEASNRRVMVRLLPLASQ